MRKTVQWTHGLVVYIAGLWSGLHHWMLDVVCNYRAGCGDGSSIGRLFFQFVFLCLSDSCSHKCVVFQHVDVQCQARRLFGRSCASQSCHCGCDHRSVSRFDSICHDLLPFSTKANQLSATLGRARVENQPKKPQLCQKYI